MKRSNQLQSLGLILLLVATLFSLAVASLSEHDETVASNASPVEVIAEAGVGDGHRATEVPLGHVTDIAIDGAGAVYFVDAVYSRVRKINAAGVISTVFNGHDRDVASSPRALAIDTRTGALYIADDRANRVWVVREGDTEPFAGTGMYGFSGDGGPATAAELRVPADLAVAPDGTVYIADRVNHRIRAVTADGTIRTIAGGLPPDIDINEAHTRNDLFQPEIVAAASDGSMYVVDRQRRRLQWISPDGSAKDLSPGTATVSGLALTVDGRLLVASAGQVSELSDDVLVPFVDPQGSSTSLVAASGTDEIVAYNSFDHLMFRTHRDGTTRRIAGNGTVGRYGDRGPANGATFSCYDLVVNKEGEIQFTDPLNGRIAIIRGDGTLDTLLERLAMPLGIARDEGGALYVAERNAHRIVRLNPDATTTVVAGNGSAGFDGDGRAATEASLDAPSDVVVGGNGELFISDGRNHRIRRVDTSGTISTVATLSARPQSLALDANGNVVVTSPAVAHPVTIPQSSDSVSLEVSPDSPSGSDELAPTALAASSDGQVFFARPGKLAAQSATAMATLPWVLPASVPGMTFDIAGNLLFCDATQPRILRVNTLALRDASALAFAK